MCPPGSVCTAGGCASPADVDACKDKSEGDACRAGNGGTGVCQGGACHTGLCGNGKKDIGEKCDGTVGLDPTKMQMCSDDCTQIYECGNAVKDPMEECDDGNQNAADGCDQCKRSAWSASVLVGTAVDATTISLANPGALAVDGLGRIYIADTYNHRIRRIEQDGSLTTLAGTGVAGFSGDGGAATSADLDLPGGIAVDGIGQVFISDTANHRIRRISTDGMITTIAGTGVAGYDATNDGKAATLAELSSPHGLVVDGLGRIFIADTDNHAIRRIDVDGTITTVAGTPPNNGFGADAIPAITSALDTPYSVAVDAQGRVVIADSLNQRIRRIELDDTITTVAGTGNLGYNGDGIDATTADLAGPAAVAVDTQGRILIIETVMPRVRRVALNGTISTIAGDGTPGFTGDGGPATAAQFSLPTGIAVDPIGKISIADTNNQRVRTVATDGTITTAGGTGTFGFGGDSTEATSALLAGPFDVVLDAQGRIYIADTFHNTIRRVELDGTMSVFAGNGIAGDSGDGGPARAAQLNGPNGLVFDTQGRLVIADVFNNRIKRVDGNGVITTIAGTGVAGTSVDGGQATASKLDHPNDVAIDAQGRVIIADTYNSKIRRIEANGTITTIAGTGTAGYDTDNVQATTTRLAFPYSVAVDAMGRVLIPDTANQRVRRVDGTGVITTIVGTGAQGYNGSGLAATASKIDGPQAAHVDSLGRVVFSDVGNHLLRRIELDGTLSTVAGSPGVSAADGDGGPAASSHISNPHGLIIDSMDRIVFPDTNNNRVRRIANGTISTIAGRIDPENVGPIAKARLDDPQAIVVATGVTFVAGGSSGTLEAIRGTRVEAVAGFYPQTIPTSTLARFRTDTFKSVAGVAFDPASNLIYITETSGNRLHVITQVDPANPLTWTIAPLANTAGTAGFADGAAATAAFRSPSGLYLDSAAHQLYIADTGNHAIRALDLTTNMVRTIANTSHALGFGGDTLLATDARLYRPTAVTRCPNGDLFVADTGNNRVRRIDGNGIITTVLGDGVPASSGEGSPAHTFPVDGPKGLACDSFGNLYVTSTTTVRLVTASDSHVVDGSGSVKTIYGAPPRDSLSSITSCLTAVAVTGSTTLQITDACTGLLVQLSRATTN